MVSVTAALASCHKPAPPLPPEQVHYTVGSGWRGERGVWFYPREDFAYQATGLAVVDRDTDAHITADGEHYDRSAMAGAHQTLQLPSIVTVRNLDNGRQVTIRLNDRGPADPGRILSVTPTVARTLGIGDAPARVEIVEDESRSRQINEQSPDARHLAIQAAPVGAVSVETLGGAPSTTPTRLPDSAQAEHLAVDHLPVTYAQGYATGGTLWVDAGDFSQRRYAGSVARRCGARVDYRADPRGLVWHVRAGPFADVAGADKALDQILAEGVTGARIVVEQN
ncbi:hypothetical protein KGY14_00155 [Ameyamaea chiangmaiensis]|uniref:RlpA-like protein double-psi beta-barrel domain-containing protein n=2 Tax=Ameyamaea chiangmaiensis TaxID=442969 RepID=A0A850PH17_9PROT|nr:RlpA-like double-psi beta-barrel domain-containing protein [Ameyamaea chiangmaiensis]MBS4073596.1 hypothetical protein [Ameyamaea chiangmaiensis]NVN41710.1 hypothetical protein [Ameyamaea chiangmaiensis]